jgi:hypothetical protein
MRTRLFVALVSAWLAAPLLAQAPAEPPGKAQTKERPKSLKVVGCVAPDAASASHFTLADFDTGAPTYRLSGRDVRRYLGRRVEVIGVEPKLKIVGGLTPSPNVAAQAGSMDPTHAAMAQQGAQGNAQPGNILVPELRVTAVKAVAGACSPK